jgi:hypothetical protein
MNVVTYVFGIVAALVVLAAIIELMRRSTLRERHAVWWLVAAILALVLAVFPQTLTWAAHVLHVSVPANLVFFIAIVLLFLVSLQYGAELTRAEDKLRSLAEQSAFHEQRLRELENEIGISAATTESEASGPEAAAEHATGEPEAGEQR